MIPQTNPATKQTKASTDSVDNGPFTYNNKTVDFSQGVISMPIRPNQICIFVPPAITFALTYLLSVLLAGEKEPDVIIPVFASIAATLSYFTVECASVINNRTKTIAIGWRYLGFEKYFQLCTFDEVHSVAGAGYKTDKKPPRDFEYATHIIYGKGKVCRITDPSTDSLTGAKTMAKRLARHLSKDFYSGQPKTALSVRYDEKSHEVIISDNANPTDMAFVALTIVCLGLLLLSRIL